MKRNVASPLIATVLVTVLLVTCGVFRKGPQYWNKDWGPLVPHKSFPGDCDLCHLPDGWESIRPGFSFDHAAETGFERELEALLLDLASSDPATPASR